MGIRIPPKIKPYPGLVKAWKAKHGSPGRSYDPPEKKRSIRHSSKPKKPRMKTGYGKMNKKPFARGSRGGFAWTGGKTPRYDPRDYRGSRRKKAKDKLTQMWQKIEKRIDPITSLVGFLVTFIGITKASYDSLGGATDPKNYFLERVPNEIKQIFGLKGTWQDPIKYLTWKFTDPESHWSAPFIASLVTYLLCKLGILDMGLSLITKKSKRIIKPIQNLSGGVLLASTIGGLIMPGSTPGNAPSGGSSHSSGNPTRNPSSMWS